MAGNVTKDFLTSFHGIDILCTMKNQNEILAEMENLANWLISAEFCAQDKLKLTLYIIEKVKEISIEN